MKNIELRSIVKKWGSKKIKTKNILADWGKTKMSGKSSPKFQWTDDEIPATIRSHSKLESWRKLQDVIPDQP